MTFSRHALYVSLYVTHGERSSTKANPRPSRLNWSASARIAVIDFGSPENVRAMKFGAGIESAVRIEWNGGSTFPSNPSWLVGEA